MNRDQSLALLNEYYYSRLQNGNTGDCVGRVQNIAEQILQVMAAADEVERMGLRIKTLECERDAWRESSDAYKADLVASDSHVDSINNPAAWPDLNRERERLKTRIRAAHEPGARHPDNCEHKTVVGGRCGDCGTPYFGKRDGTHED